MIILIFILLENYTLLFTGKALHKAVLIVQLLQLFLRDAAYPLRLKARAEGTD